MVVDRNLFLAGAGQALAPGTLYVIEQIPGTVVAADVTSKLELGYWPSYNVPYFDEIYKKSGYVSLDERKGKRAGSEYQLAPVTEWVRPVSRHRTVTVSQQVNSRFYNIDLFKKLCLFLIYICSSKCDNMRACVQCEFIIELSVVCTTFLPVILYLIYTACYGNGLCDFTLLPSEDCLPQQRVKPNT